MNLIEGTKIEHAERSEPMPHDKEEPLCVLDPFRYSNTLLQMFGLVNICRIDLHIAIGIADPVIFLFSDQIKDCRLEDADKCKRLTKTISHFIALRYHYAIQASSQPINTLDLTPFFNYYFSIDFPAFISYLITQTAASPSRRKTDTLLDLLDVDKYNKENGYIELAYDITKLYDDISTQYAHNVRSMDDSLNVLLEFGSKPKLSEILFFKQRYPFAYTNKTFRENPITRILSFRDQAIIQLDRYVSSADVCTITISNPLLAKQTSSDYYSPKILGDRVYDYSKSMNFESLTEHPKMPEMYLQYSTAAHESNTVMKPCKQVEFEFSQTTNKSKRYSSDESIARSPIEIKGSNLDEIHTNCILGISGGEDDIALNAIDIVTRTAMNALKWLNDYEHLYEELIGDVLHTLHTQLMDEVINTETKARVYDAQFNG